MCISLAMPREPSWRFHRKTHNHQPEPAREEAMQGVRQTYRQRSSRHSLTHPLRMIEPAANHCIEISTAIGLPERIIFSVIQSDKFFRLRCQQHGFPPPPFQAHPGSYQRSDRPIPERTAQVAGIVVNGKAGSSVRPQHAMHFLDTSHGVWSMVYHPLTVDMIKGFVGIRQCFCIPQSHIGLQPEETASAAGQFHRILS